MPRQTQRKPYWVNNLADAVVHASLLKPVTSIRRIVSLFGTALIGVVSLNTASAASSPVPLLVEQCLRQPPIDLASAFASMPNATLADKALMLERETIGLNNINDRVNYYRRFPLSSDERQGLLQCQLRLADTLSQLLNQTAFQLFASALSKHPDNRESSISASNELRQLSRQLLNLTELNWSQSEKSQLSTAQARIRQGLASQHFQLNIPSERCQLPPSLKTSVSTNTAQETLETTNKDPSQATNASLSATIAHYLLMQPDAQCRQSLWQSYQGRARGHNQAALERIAALRQQQALDAGYSDFAHYRLHAQQLASPELVKDFLDSQTEMIGVAPWDIGRQLMQLSAANVPTIPTVNLLNDAFKVLNELGLRFEALDSRLGQTELMLDITAPDPQQHILRVYHQGRLLGEIYLAIDTSLARDTKNAKHSQATLRQSVLGQQFGQQALDLSPEVATYRDIEQFTDALSDAVVALARGGHFYLTNTQEASLDSNRFAALWLSALLRERLFPQFETIYLGPKERLAKAYSKQFNVFQAKVALNFALSSTRLSYLDLSAEFTKSFGQTWQQVSDYPYSFNAVANEGPLYYQSLWQEQLAQLVSQQTRLCQDNAALFTRLVVNEASLNQEALLSASIGNPVDAASLIQRIKTINSTKMTATCLR